MEKTEILPGIEAVGAALWIDKLKILIIGDVHIGYEEALSKRGLAIPRLQFKESMNNIREILECVGKPEIIVINGDLKHEFGEISDQEWFETSKFLDFLIKNSSKVYLIKGNHDTILAPIAKRRGLEIVDYTCFDLKEKAKKKSIFDIKPQKIKSFCVLHGDKVWKDKSVNNVDLLIMGHEHPAITLEEGPKREKYKCFLSGKMKKQRLIIAPSFLPISVGVDMRGSKFHSPYLKGNLDNFEVFVVGDKVYRFGKLKNL
ncbi:metallophosphoesterase [Nanoarchaeota archaeon]